MVLELDGSAAWPHGAARPAVAIGNFDGVHTGHRAVLAELKRLSDDLGVARAVLTFDPAPTAVLAPTRHQPRILTRHDRVERLHEAGASIVIVEEFTRQFAEQEAGWFANTLLRGRLNVAGVVVGYDFRFGRGRGGDAEALQRLLPEIPVIAVPPHRDDGEPVSSSRVRRLVAAGDVEGAARLLGRPHILHGPVVHGDHRGSTIGFPTANISSRVELLPARGVYVVRASLADGRSVIGVTNVGVRPTFDGQENRIEVHLLDFAGDLYGQELRIELLHRLRGELRFPDIGALVAQITADVSAARNLRA